MKITHFLRSRRRAVTAQQIADEFDISVRTVYRDVQDLMDAHVPITGEAGVGCRLTFEVQHIVGCVCDGTVLWPAQP
ncbi:MAG: helix-turn-helix domain-containing protein [Pseudomonadota bacterium]